VCHLQFAAGPRQRSQSRVGVPRYSRPYLTVSDSRLPQPGWPGSRIYIPQEQGGPVIPPGTGFPFHRLLRLAGLRWRRSNPPPQGPNSTKVKVTLRLNRTSPRYIAPARTAQKTSLPLFRVLSLPGKRVHRAVPYQRLFYCRLFTQRLLGSGSTCHNILRRVRNPSLQAQNVACFRYTVALSKDYCSVRTALYASDK
jgi:hypothetical protein